MKRSSFLLLGAILTNAHADVKPSTLFGSGMVLQRDMPVPVWGSAASGEKVNVTFAGQNKSATAGKDGKWMVKLEPLKASAEGRTLVVSGPNKVEFKDVLVGEVWICAGQSNMALGRDNVPELEALLPDAQKKPLRTFHVAAGVALEPEENCQGGWSSSPSTSAVAFGFSYYLHDRLKVPVAVIQTCWGSTSIEGWMPVDMTRELPSFAEAMKKFEKEDKEKVVKILEEQKHAPATGKKGGKKGGGADVYLRTRPNIVYNAMMHPLAPFAARGIAWYQGEANAGNPEQYAKSLPAWLLRMRKHFDHDDLHALVVMLPKHDSKNWPAMREAQMRIRNTPHTSVVNTIDLGDPKNLHPRDKQPIGQRLALIAARDVYQMNVVAEGPRFKSFKIEGASVRISFEHAEGLKTTDGQAPTEFLISGKDRQWHQAAARIDDQTIVLMADGLTDPVAVRYAFSSCPQVNLINGAGLPAYPFREE